MTARVGIAWSHLDDVLDRGPGTVEGWPSSPHYNLAIVSDGIILIDMNVTTLTPMKIVDGDSLLTNHFVHVYLGTRKDFVLRNRSKHNMSCYVLLWLLGALLIPATPLILLSLVSRAGSQMYRCCCRISLLHWLPILAFSMHTNSSGGHASVRTYGSWRFGVSHDLICMCL